MAKIKYFKIIHILLFVSILSLCLSSMGAALVLLVYQESQSEHGHIITMVPWIAQVDSANRHPGVFRLASLALPTIPNPEPLQQNTLELSPKSPIQLFSDAYGLAMDGNYDEAKIVLQKALEKDSSLFEARLLLGWILMKQNKKEAIEEFKKCKEQRPDDATSIYFLAYVLDKFGSFEEAIENYSEVIEIDSTDVRALTKMASLYEVKGDTIKAWKFFEKARRFERSTDSISVVPLFQEIPIPVLTTSREDLHPPPENELPPDDTWWYEEMPQIIHFEVPKYPKKAKKAGLECLVIVYILVDKEGNPAKVKIAKPCGKVGFNEAAETAAWKCKFTPGTQVGKPVRVWVSLPFRFSLTGGN